MERKLLRFGTGAIFALLVMTSLLALVATAAGPEDTIATRAPGDTYLDMGAHTLPATVYPGDEVDFAFSVDENYDGEEWDDDYDVVYPAGLAGWVYNVGVVIMLDNNVPITWNARSVWIPDTEPQYNFSVNAWFAHNDDGDDFSFTVDTTNLMPGTYEIRVQVNYEIAVGYNYATTTDPFDYNFTVWATETLIIEFDVDSCLDNEFDTTRVLSFTATTGNPGSIYSGAQMQKVAWRAQAAGAIGHVMNVTVTLTIPSTGDTAGITLGAEDPQAGFCFRPDLYNSYQYFYFYLDVTTGIPAGVKEGAYVMVEYEREIDDVWVDITEAIHYDVDFTIAFTPIIDIVPGHADGTMSHLTIDQNDVKANKLQTLSFDIQNIGNVDLTGCMVELYLEDSYFIDEHRFYRLETSYTSIYTIDEVYDAGAMNADEIQTISFDANFAAHLPPGQYGIRVYYDLEYYDNGELGDSTQIETANEGLYDPIQSARGNTGVFYDYMYLMIDITDDDGMDMFAYATQETPGQTYEQVQVTVVNYEYYGLTDVTAELDPGMYFEDAMAPEVPAGNTSGNETPVGGWIPEYGQNSNNFEDYVWDANPGFDQNVGQYHGYTTETFYFLVNVREDITDTYGYTQMRIVGVDQFHQEHVIVMDVMCSFYPGSPDLFITNAWSTNRTGPGSTNVEYKVTITNVGDSEAENMEFLLRCNLDVLIIDQPYKFVATPLEPGDSITLTWIIHFTDKAREAQSWSDQYLMYLSWGYEDRDGEIHNLNSNSESMYIKTSAVEQVDPVQQKEPIMSNDVSDLVTQIIWAIAVVAAALVLMLGLFKLASGRKPAAKPADEFVDEPGEIPEDELPPPEEEDEVPPPEEKEEKAEEEPKEEEE